MKTGIAGIIVGDEVVSVLESQQGERLSGSFPRGPVIEGWACDSATGCGRGNADEGDERWLGLERGVAVTT
jgi:hypothetical protein